jgi:cytochrome d ubiquinol oxidase subunit I
MDALLLARIQFAWTVAFHYIFPPMTIGLGLMLVVMEGMYLRTKNPLYHAMTRFWARIFGLIFAVGVASGIVMEFQFGTNWSTYSRYVGDVFGSALAAEGIFAFFLESGFLAILLFGWDRVSPKVHFFSTVMVSLGSIFSAVWIVVANSWQQTPAGFHIVGEGARARAEVTDFWQVVFNPSTVDRLLHVLIAAVLTGAFFVLSVSAFYLLKRRHLEFAKASLRIALAFAVVASLAQLLSGHSSARVVAEHQPAKLAAFEGIFPEKVERAPLRLFGWVDETGREVKFSVSVPGMLSWLVHGDSARAVRGLDAFPPGDRPPVNLVFQSYHAMVAIGMALIGLSLLSLLYLRGGRLFETPWLLKILVAAVVLPHLANQLGWLSAEVGRQPWIVYGLLRTADAVSPVVSAGQTLTSLILFTLVYLLLFALFIFLLDHKIKEGPVEGAVEKEGHLA